MFNNRAFQAAAACALAVLAVAGCAPPAESASFFAATGRDLGECNLDAFPGDDDGCLAPDDLLVRELTRLESNFRECRIRTNLGNAGSNPRSFIINAVDTQRRIDTRTCLLAEPAKALGPRQAHLVRTMALAAGHVATCGNAEPCLEVVERAFTEEMAEPAEDSLMYLAMREAVVHFSMPPYEVGNDWWMLECRSFRARDATPTTTEESVCATIQAVYLYKLKRDGPL